MIVSINNYTQIRNMLMEGIQIERLKKDKNEAMYYRKRLIKKGKDVLAYKMSKKIEHLDYHINQMEIFAGGAYH